MLEAYYNLRGWANGVVPEAKLDELDIEYRGVAVG
jgi:hypothetical protein